MKIAIYPGTFDPITYGHIDVIRRSARLFDRLVVLVAPNPDKRPFFSTQLRLRMIRTVIRPIRNVSVESFQGLLVDYARRKQATAIIRGLRAVSDFEKEFQMTLMNRKLNPKIETVFMMPNERHTYLSSSIVKEIAMRGGDVSGFVPTIIAEKLYRRFLRKGSAATLRVR